MEVMELCPPPSTSPPFLRSWPQLSGVSNNPPVSSGSSGRWSAVVRLKYKGRAGPRGHFSRGPTSTVTTSTVSENISRPENISTTVTSDVLQHFILRGDLWLQQSQQPDPVRRSLQGVRRFLLREALRDIRVRRLCGVLQEVHQAGERVRV